MADLSLERSTFEFIAKYTRDVIVRVDRYGRVTYASPSIRFYGYDPDEICGTSGRHLFHEDDVGRFEANVAEVLRGEAPTTTDRQLRFRRADGEWTWVEGAPQPIFDEAGRVVEFVNIFRDITDRRIAAEQAREQAELFETAFQQSASGKALVGLDGRYIKVNPALCRIVGYDEAALLALDFNTLTHPDDQDLDTAQKAQMREGRSRSYIVHKRYLRADGSEAPVKVTVSLITHADGSPKNFLTEVEDLSERLAAEAALEQSELRYQVIAENTSDIITMSTLEGLLTYVSPSIRQLGFAPDDLVGGTALAHVFPDDARVAWRVMRNLQQGGATQRVRWRGRHRQTGEWRWMESSPSPLRDPKTGEITGLLDVIRDVSAQVQHQEELAAAQLTAEAAAVAKSEFLANMSHEIRTPLTAVLGFAGLLQSLNGMPAEARTYLDRIATSGQSLLSVVNDILDFSRLDAGQIHLDPQPFDPAAMIVDSINLVAPSAAQKGLTIDYAFDGHMPECVEADSARLRQVLLNLLSNAVKFTDAGRIAVTAGYQASGGRLWVSVNDTGRGIPEDRLDRLFQRFSQIDGSNTRQHGGSGLGLAISKALLDLMGGEINVESRVGEGSTFQLSISASVVAAAPVNPIEDVQGEPFTSADILVVDDVAVNRELIRIMLEPFGFHITEAANGADAVAEAMARPFDLILMDLQMPGMDGLAATRAIRASCELNRTTPILAISANVLPFHLAECRAAGMDDHIAKPITPTELLTKIGAWLERAEPATALAG